MRSLAYLFLVPLLLFFQKASTSETLYERIKSNKAISHSEKKACLPFLLKENHPAKPTLEKLFKERIVLDLNHLLKAGFKLISDLPEKKIIVATHPDLEGYVVKLFLDTVSVNKFGDPNWKWLSRRAYLSSKIRKFIKKNNIKRFKAAQKWLYPLPQNGENTNNWILLAEKMPLVSARECLDFWKEKLSQKDLKELYKIMKSCGGHSYRPDNIPVTKEGCFVFIDTEYPHLPPIYTEIIPYISEEMASFWKLHVLSHELSQNSSIDSLARKREKN